MVDLTFEQCFKTLKIQNSTTFEDTRKAYKKQMHRLHPDRFPNDIKAQANATDQFMHVRNCFKLIEEYYKTYGEMPIVTLDVDKTYTVNRKQSRTSLQKTNQYERELLQKASSLSRDTGSFYDGTATPVASKNKGSTSASELGIGLLVIGILAYFFLTPSTPTIEAQESEAYLENEIKAYITPNIVKPDTDTASTASLAMDMPNTSQSIPGSQAPIVDRLVDEKNRAKAILSNNQQGLQQAANGKSFTFGSTFKEVAVVHGAPDRSKKDTWFYEKSKVIFRDGRVIDWQSDPSHPLATRLK